MPVGNWNLQWLNHNSQRSYPLADHGNGKDVSGSIELPDSFIVALYLPVHAGLDVEPDKFYLQSLGIFPTGYNIAVGYNNGTTNPLVASVNVAKSTHVENRSYAVAGADDFDDTVGKIAIGKLDAIENLAPGQYVFAPEATPLEPDAIRPMIRGVSSITVVSGQDRSPRLYGDIELVAGENMRIVANVVEGQDPQVIFSAIDGEGLNEECICDEESEGPCIRFINGIPPTADGNFRAVGDDCMEITPIDNGLKYNDKCSEPCCGCEELEALTRQIDRFADGVLTLRNFVSNLGAEVTQMSQVVLGSRLGDQGCVEC